MWLKIKAFSYLTGLFGRSLSSKRILIGGEASSSNCPDLTLQINATKKTIAILILANNKMIMALILLLLLLILIIRMSKVSLVQTMTNDINHIEL